MFGRRFFGGHYFGGRFFGDGGDTTPVGPSASAIWAYVLPNGKSAGQNLAEINTLLTGEIDGGLDFMAAMQVLLAVAAGRTRITALGGGAAHVEFDAAGGTDLRVAAEMQGSERVTVDITPSS